MRGGSTFTFEYGGVLYKVRAAVAAGQTMRLPALMFADEGGGAAAEAETVAVAGAVAGAGAGAGAVQVAVRPMGRVERRRMRKISHHRNARKRDSSQPE